MLPSAFSTTSSGLGFFSPITSMAPYTIFSATDFLPLYITMLMKRAMVSLPCFGSGSTERCGVFPLRDIVRFSVGQALARRLFRMAGHYPPRENPPGRIARDTQAFGRLAPYLERACLRFATPAASSEPRTVW